MTGGVVARLARGGTWMAMEVAKKAHAEKRVESFMTVR